MASQIPQLPCSRPYGPVTLSQLTWHFYATTYNNGGSSASHASTTDDCLTTASDLNWSVCLQSLSILVRFKVMLWPTASQPVCLGVRHPSGAQDQVFITVRQLQVCWCGCPLWWEDRSVVYNCCWPLPAQSFSGPSSAELMTVFCCLRLKTPPTWRARSPYLYPPGRGRPSYTPRHWVPSVTSYESQGYGGVIRTHLHHWYTCPVGRSGTASGHTHQKEHFIAAAILHRHNAVRVDRTEITTSDRFLLLCA
jgi:hypothetical protein